MKNQFLIALFMLSVVIYAQDSELDKKSEMIIETSNKIKGNIVEGKNNKISLLNRNVFYDEKTDKYLILVEFFNKNKIPVIVKDFRLEKYSEDNEINQVNLKILNKYPLKEIELGPKSFGQAVLVIEPFLINEKEKVKITMYTSHANVYSISTSYNFDRTLKSFDLVEKKVTKK